MAAEGNSVSRRPGKSAANERAAGERASRGADPNDASIDPSFINNPEMSNPEIDRTKTEDTRTGNLPAEDSAGPFSGQSETNRQDIRPHRSQQQRPPVPGREAEGFAASSPGNPPRQIAARGYNPSYSNSGYSASAYSGAGYSRAGATGRAASLAKGNWLGPHTAQALEASIDTTLTQWRGKIQTVFADPVTPVRLASHLSVLVVAALILVFSQLDLPDWQFSLRALPSTSFLGTNIGGSLQGGMSALLTEQTGAVFSNGESLQRAAVPFTVPNARPEEAAAVEGEAGAGANIKGEIQSYTVQAGDTVLGIAERFGLQPETIQWANSTLEINPDLIRPGDELNILPVDGVLHTIRSGDTLSSIANRYSVSVDDILGYTHNGLPNASSSLTVGRQLVIPDGTKPQAQSQAVAYTSSSTQTPSNAQVGSGNFVWPSSGPINQRYWSGHPAVDIGGWTGAPVSAADGGYVAVARGGWNGGYGNHVIIDHGNGFATLYAHLNSIFVKPGESVSRGQQVGSIGNTGNSTGPHLHFEIRYQGAARNPLNYLP